MSLRRRKIEPEAECRCGGERWNRRANVVAAGKDGTGGRMSLRRRKMEPESDSRCGGKRWNRRANVVAAEKDGTGGRMSLRRRKMEPEAECRCGGAGCHSGGFLLRIMPPSWQPVPACVRHGHSEGGPFLAAAAMVLQAEPIFFAATTIVLQAGRSYTQRR